MRAIATALIAATLAACTTAPQPVARTAQAEQKLQQLLAGRVAGQPVACLPQHRADDMIIVDDNTLLFRAGGNRIYRSDMQGSCSRLGTGHYALVTNRFGGTSLCRGEIAQVVDVQNGFAMGSCAFGDFVPYTR